MSSPPTILIVDDCEEDRQSYVRFLTKNATTTFRFPEAGTLDEARALLAQMPPVDCMLLDYQLPDGQGLDLLRDDPATRGFPVLMLTGLGNETVAVEAMRSGARGYLVKDEITAPQLVEEVLTAIEDACTRQELAATEAELARANARNQLILETVVEGILGLDQERTITFANPSAASYLGSDISAIIGGSIHAFVHRSSTPTSSHPAPACPLVPALLDDEPRGVAEDRFSRSDDTSLTVEYTASPILGSDGTVSGGVLAFRDVSEQRDLQQQLLESQKLESVGRLASGIAHEINTPTQFVSDNVDFLRQVFFDLTNVLKGYSELLGAPEGAGTPGLLERLRGETSAADFDYLVEEIPRALEQSLEGLRRISEIVLAMRDFAHPGAAEKTAIDLNRAIRSTLTVARNEWKYLADLETDFASDLRPVPCLAGELNQTILNILVNAAHAIGDVTENGARGKGRITIRTRQEDHHACIEISDTGPGIPEAIRSQIFDPFFTTREVGRGTGQGLAIARSVIVDKHSGALECHTEVGRGTTFVIRIPLDDGNAVDSGILE